MERLKYPSERPPAVPRQRRAFSTWGGPVDTVGAAAEADLLRRLFDVDQGLSRALTHGFHSYAGRLPPSLARLAIETFSAPGDLVVDPFCGSGTVLVEAFGLGRRAFGSDVSPLAVLIAETRSSCLTGAARAELIERAARVAEESAEAARKRQRPDVPPWAENEFGRFHPHIVLELLGLRALAFAEADAAPEGIGRALRMVFSSILVKFMKAGSEAPRDGEAKRIGRGQPSRLYLDRTHELVAGLTELELRAAPGIPAPIVKLADARELRGVRDASVTLVLTSPPYAGTYDYGAQHDVRFAWLELPRRGFNQRQIGGRSGGMGAHPEGWSEARRAWLEEMSRVLLVGGHAVLVVGDGVVGARPEHGAEAVEQVAEFLGLEPVARASQDRPIMDRRLSALFGQRVRQEHVVLLRKTKEVRRKLSRPPAPPTWESRTTTEPQGGHEGQGQGGFPASSPPRPAWRPDPVAPPREEHAREQKRDPARPRRDSAGPGPQVERRRPAPRQWEPYRGGSSSGGTPSQEGHGGQPGRHPSPRPSGGPSRGPSGGPSRGPSGGPSRGPSGGPSRGPSGGPSRGRPPRG